MSWGRNPSSDSILDRFNNEGYIPLGSITKSTQGLSGSMYTETETSNEESYLFLKKGKFIIMN